MLPSCEFLSPETGSQHQNIYLLIVLGDLVVKYFLPCSACKLLGECLLGETESNTGKDGQGVNREVNMDMKSSAVKATRE